MRSLAVSVVEVYEMSGSNLPHDMPTFFMIGSLSVALKTCYIHMIVAFADRAVSTMLTWMNVQLYSPYPARLDSHQMASKS